MSISTLIGTLGVSLLLLAFFLNQFRNLPRDSNLYLALNIIGAGFSAYASLLIDFMPFVILEGTWCLVALAALVKKGRGA